MLKYLFTAFYEDGSHYEQTPEDKSVTTSGRSAYFDIDHSKLISFTLYSKETDFSVSVDLRDGSFHVNGLQVYLHENLIVENIRLIYFRRVTQTLNTANGNSQTTTEFHIGWQGNIPGTGENIKHTMAFV